jgi:hypothetical protein
MRSKVKMFMFARWIVILYDSEVLNTEDGNWWKEQLEYFDSKVYPSYLKNGSVKETTKFLNNEN